MLSLLRRRHGATLAAAIGRDAIVSLDDLGGELAAPVLVGPSAEDVLAAAGLDTIEHHAVSRHLDVRRGVAWALA